MPDPDSVYFTDRLLTPWGALGLTVDQAGALVHVAFLDQDSRVAAARWLRVDPATLQPAPARVARAKGWFDAYLAGRPGAANDLDLALRGTDFQRRVWAALCALPAGTTTTYTAVAATLGRPASAARAVGRAVGTNPVPIVVPCHRVVGSDGSLTGFAGGLAFKRGLLDHEARFTDSTEVEAS